MAHILYVVNVKKLIQIGPRLNCINRKKVDNIDTTSGYKFFFTIMEIQDYAIISRRQRLGKPLLMSFYGATIHFQCRPNYPKVTTMLLYLL